MANRLRIARFTAAQALRLILDAQVPEWGHLSPPPPLRICYKYQISHLITLDDGQVY